MLINPFTANTGYLQIYVGYIFARSASSPHRDEVTADLILFNMKNDTVKPVCNDHPLYNKIYYLWFYTVMCLIKDWRHQFTFADDCCILELI